MGEVMSDYIAIGDIHGDIKKLRRLLAAVETLYTDQQIVFLGDYVDKGSHSKEVINLLLEVKFKYKSKCVFLIGNHELVCLMPTTNHKAKLLGRGLIRCTVTQH